MLLNPLLSALVMPVGNVTPLGFTPLGTAFVISDRRLATAAHVTAGLSSGLHIVLPRSSPFGYQDTTNTEVKTFGVRIVAHDPIADISILELENGVFEGELPYQLGDSDGVRPGTSVISLGHPHADHGRLVLTQFEPLVGAKVYLASGVAKIKHLVLNMQTRPGQSGSPVFTDDGRTISAMVTGSFRFVGGGVMIAGIDPATLHQTTHAVSAEYIRKML